ncbi:MAG: lipoprotein-releasing system transmembrane subunit LolC [Deltaproteobacteria bacterium]|nr:MAG: lipoprotein-releasing system transmembrane subunit LolC [Deltaproteobacteria bacterium]
MRFELFIALRYLIAKRQQAFISVISLISILGVGLGVAALIIVIGVMTGFSDNLRDKILGINAHILVGSMDKGFTQYNDLVDKARSVKGVTSATPFIYSEVIFSSPGGAKGAVLRGIDAHSAGSVLSISKDLQKGSLQGLDTSQGFPGVIVGKELARGLGLTMGSRVNIMSPAGKKTSAGFSPKIMTFQVCGIFATEVFEYDASLAYVSISAAQKLLGMKEDRVTGIELKVDDVYGVEVLSDQVLEALGGFPFYVRHWIEMNKNLFSALKLEKTAMGIILIMIVLVGSFSIVTTLIMMVMEKTRDIAVLMSLGATRRTIRNIFILQGTIIGCIGTGLGYLLGLGSCFLLKKYQFIKLPADVYHLDHIPITLEWLDMTFIGVAAMLLCFLATIYPARQAASMEPAEALRYE